VAVLVAGCASPSSPTASAGASEAAGAPGATATPSGPSGSAAAGTPGSAGTPAAHVPGFGHVYLIVLENRGLSQVLDSTTAPYLHSLMQRYGLATNYHSVAHPSEPNYLALFSGSTQGVTDDGVHDIAARTLADQLDAAGRSWRVFAENVPLGCYRGATASGGPDGPGNYARKHEPAISFTAISGNPARCANITDFGHFDPAAADFELIIPNLCNDMHDCSVAAGDRFLASFVPRILQSAAWQQGGVLFITFDEGQGSQPIATLVIAPDVAPDFRSAVAHDHYSLLRTIENAWGLPCLANSCGANDLREFFLPAPSTTSP
jgi:hypothetical protein